MAENADPYSQYFVTLNLSRLETEAVELALVLEADGAIAQASQVRRAFIRLLEELKAIAVKIARVAEQRILHAEATSRVRPDTGGAGGIRLSTNLGISHPLPEVEGSVGINYEPDLVDWWWTNEEGYDGHIGREIQGLFYPGAVGPHATEFRVHPLFTPSKGGPKGVIRNPIPARHFVEHGAAEAEAQWHLEVRAAKARFLGECDRALTAKVRPKPRVRP